MKLKKMLLGFCIWQKTVVNIHVVAVVVVVAAVVVVVVVAVAHVFVGVDELIVFLLLLGLVVMTCFKVFQAPA